jgi:hypothetical protein
MARNPPALRLEHLSPERVVELWPQIEPLIEQVIPRSQSAPNPIDTDYIRITATHGGSHILAFYVDGALDMVLSFEFTVAKSVRTATILALAGRNLLFHKMNFWPIILDWFRSAGASSVDAYAEPRLANIYMRKFGFTETSSYVRMAL